MSNIEIYKYDFISINKFINDSINITYFLFDELILKNTKYLITKIYIYTKKI